MRRVKLTLPACPSCKTDGDGLFRSNCSVQHRDGGGHLALLRRQTSGAQLGADQVFVSRHRRFCVVSSAVPGRLLSPSAAIPCAEACGTSGSYAHAAALCHVRQSSRSDEPDVAVTMALGTTVVAVRAWHRRRRRRDDELLCWMALVCSRRRVGGLVVVGTVRYDGGDHGLHLPKQSRHLCCVLGLIFGQHLGGDLIYAGASREM